MKTSFAILFLALSSLVNVAQDAPLTILEKPRPELPADYGTLDAQGTIRLKIEFRGDATIGKIVVVTGMPVSNLTGFAIEAAKKIRFNPEIRGGKPVSLYKSVEYTYAYWQSGKGKAVPKETPIPVQVVNDAEAVLQKAVQNLGGNVYLKVYSQIGRGRFSIIKEGVNISSQTFVDVIVFPDKERSEFKAAGVKSVQTNTGSTGWVFDGDQELIKVQTEKQVANFRRGIRTSLDNLLRGYWKGDAELTYIGRRPGTLGKRNDAVRLTYKDGFVVEFEFAADDATPVKAVYKTTGPDGEPVTEEDRYAQFVDTQGITAPYVVDRFINGKHASRINFLTVEYNKRIPDSIFTKPSDPKELKKELKL